MKKFKSKETIVTRRKDRSTSKTAITKSEGEKTAATAGGASLWCVLCVCDVVHAVRVVVHACGGASLLCVLGCMSVAVLCCGA